MNAPFRTTLIAALGLLGLQAEAATIAAAVASNTL